MKGIAKKIRNSNLVIRITSWEYWPFYIFYIPVFFYWGWLCLKARSLFFFSASNPSIQNGGMLGESKIMILDLIPPEQKPLTRFVKHPYSLPALLHEIEGEFDYPMILKPDIGERGWGVARIESRVQLFDYLMGSNVDLLVQEYIDLPMELGVFYYRFPGEEDGVVSSIVIKESLAVYGDGSSTVRDLIELNPRAKLQADRLEKRMNGQMSSIPEKGENFVLEPIGNHCRGAKFLNGNSLITANLTRSINELSTSIPGFHFGRFDLKCESIEALERGEFKVMELNGAGSEPAHIYEPGTPISEAYTQIFKHLTVLYEISKKNRAAGVSYMTFAEGIAEWKKLQHYNKIKRTALT